MRRRIPEMLVAAVLATMLIFVLADLAGGVGDFPNMRWATAIAALCLAVWIGPGVFASYAHRGGGALKAVVAWLAIAVGLGLLYVYGQDALVSAGFNL
jgi:hypothetical protein